MKIDTKLKKGHWINWEDGVRFSIRPYPASQIRTYDNDEDAQMKQILDMFTYCVVDWEGFEDEDGEPFVCNDKNKKYVFDHLHNVRNYVIDRIQEEFSGREEDLKN